MSQEQAQVPSDKKAVSLPTKKHYVDVSVHFRVPLTSNIVFHPEVVGHFSQ